MTRLVFLPGMDGSGYIFSQLTSILATFPVTFVSYPQQINATWLNEFSAVMQDCILIGFSFGGLIARQIAYRNPKQIRGIILINSAYCPSMLTHRLHFLRPLRAAVPNQLANWIYLRRLEHILRYEGLDSAECLAYREQCSHISSILNRHRILKQLWIEPISLEPFWFFAPNSRELRFDIHRFSLKHPNARSHLLQGGHRCLLTHSTLVEPQILRAIHYLRSG